jgi:TRAP-type C4-dicarboxylate transport system permease small subunit
MKLLLPRLQQLTSWIDWLLCRVVVITAAFMILVLAVQVAGRYVFNLAAVSVVEAGQYSFVWLAMLSMCLAYRKHAHVSLERFWQEASPTTLKCQRTVVNAVVLAVSLCIAYGGIVLVSDFSDTVLPGLQISMGWVYVSPLVAGVIMSLFVIEFMFIDMGLAEPALGQASSGEMSMGGSAQ